MPLRQIPETARWVAAISAALAAGFATCAATNHADDSSRWCAALAAGLASLAAGLNAGNMTNDGVPHKRKRHGETKA